MVYQEGVVGWGWVDGVYYFGDVIEEYGGCYYVYVLVVLYYWCGEGDYWFFGGDVGVGFGQYWFVGGYCLFVLGMGGWIIVGWQVFGS